MLLISPQGSPSVFDIEKCRFRFENLIKYKNETIVVNLASEHWGESSLVHQLHQDLEEHGFDFWILSHHPGDHKKLERLVYYPWWYVYSRFELPPSVDIAKNRKFALGCVNGNPRPQRIVNYFALNDKFPREKICNTMLNADTLPWRHDDPEISIDERSRWENIRYTHPNKSLPVSDTDLSLPAFSDSYLYLVPETTIIDRIFITEKTWKPIASGQFFLMFGNPGTVAHLRDLGVDVYDDIISHDYDSIENWRDRLDRIHNVIDDLLQQNLEKIWNDTYERRKENQQKLFSGKFMFRDRFLFDEILEKSYVPHRRISSLDAKQGS